MFTGEHVSAARPDKSTRHHVTNVPSDLEKSGKVLKSLRKHAYSNILKILPP